MGRPEQSISRRSGSVSAPVRNQETLILPRKNPRLKKKISWNLSNHQHSKKKRNPKLRKRKRKKKNQKKRRRKKKRNSYINLLLPSGSFIAGLYIKIFVPTAGLPHSSCHIYHIIYPNLLCFIIKYTVGLKYNKK